MTATQKFIEDAVKGGWKAQVHCTIAVTSEVIGWLRGVKEAQRWLFHSRKCGWYYTNTPSL